MQPGVTAPESPLSGQGVVVPSKSNRLAATRGKLAPRQAGMAAGIYTGNAEKDHGSMHTLPIILPLAPACGDCLLCPGLWPRLGQPTVGAWCH